jgi:hypothetical protein
LRQRVIASYHLGPLDLPETQAYIEHRLQLVGWSDDPSSRTTAYSRSMRTPSGVPRRINALCSRVLLNGFLEELHQIDATVVDKVRQELDDEIAQVMDVPHANAGTSTARPMAMVHANGDANGHVTPAEPDRADRRARAARANPRSERSSARSRSPPSISGKP